MLGWADVALQPGEPRVAAAPSLGIIRPPWPLDGRSVGEGTRGPQRWGLGLALGAKPGLSCWSPLSSSNTSLLWGRRQQELLVTALVWMGHPGGAGGSGPSGWHSLILKDSKGT